MDKPNYNIQMLKIISDFSLKDKPSLLLHCCCGPCATAVIERLINYFNVTLFYYNPNTRPFSEYIKRLDTLKEFIEKSKQNLPLIEGSYDDKLYDDAVAGCKDVFEGGVRCQACISLRLNKTAEKAAECGFDYFASTLSVSPLKNVEYINLAGLNAEKVFNVKYLINDFKKDNGSKRSVELSKQYGLYRQDYCGCEMSEKIREIK